MSVQLIMLLLASTAIALASAAVCRRHQPLARRLLIVSALLLTVGSAIDLLAPKPPVQPHSGLRALKATKQENDRRQAKLDALDAELAAMRVLNGKLGPAENRRLSEIAVELNVLKEDLARRRF
jgi:hypothetical protein